MHSSLLSPIILLFFVFPYSVIPVALSTELIPRQGLEETDPSPEWNDTLTTFDLRPNSQVCKWAASNNPEAATKGKADLFMALWFTDNGGDTVNWTQKMMNNVTAYSGKTPKLFHCSDLQTGACSLDDNGDCELYNPAAFLAIQRQASNLWHIFKALDIEAFKDGLKQTLQTTALVKDLFPSLDDTKTKLNQVAMTLFLLCGLLGLAGLAAGPLGWVGASMAVPVLVTAGSIQAAANTIAAILIIAYNTWKAPDAAEVTAKADQIIYDWLDATTSWTRNITAKVFGSPNRVEADLWNFLGRMKPEYKDIEHGPDWQAIVHLFEDGDFLPPDETQAYVDSIMESGRQTLRLGIIREIYKAATVIAVRFTKYDTEAACKAQFDPDYAWVDNACWILWETPHDAGVPRVATGKIPDNNVLSKTTGKYNINKDFMFRNIVECDNDGQGMNKTYDSLSYLDEDVGKCVFPLYYLVACDEDYWKDGNTTVASKIGVDLSNCWSHVYGTETKLECNTNHCAK